MNIDEAQERYDNELKEDRVCEHCENHIRRGDEYFDLYDQECKAFNQLQEAMDELADRLVNEQLENVRLVRLLLQHKIEVAKHDEEGSIDKEGKLFYCNL